MTVVSDTDRSVDATDCGEDRPPPPGALDAEGGRRPPRVPVAHVRPAPRPPVSIALALCGRERGRRAPRGRPSLPT